METFSSRVDGVKSGADILPHLHLNEKLVANLYVNHPPNEKERWQKTDPFVFDSTKVDRVYFCNYRHYTHENHSSCNNTYFIITCRHIHNGERVYMNIFIITCRNHISTRGEIFASYDPILLFNILRPPADARIKIAKFLEEDDIYMEWYTSDEKNPLPLHILLKLRYLRTNVPTIDDVPNFLKSQIAYIKVVRVAMTTYLKNRSRCSNSNNR